MSKGLVRKRFGISKVVFEIEQLLLHFEPIKKETYLAYLKVTEKGKQKYRKRIEEIVREYAVNAELMRSIAKEIIKIEKDRETGEQHIEYNLDNEIFKYMKKNLYKGDSRKLLGDLAEYRKEV